MKKLQTNPTKSNVLVIKSLDQLQNLIDAPVLIQFSIDKQPVELPVKRMTDDLAERKRAILRTVQPPFKKERNDFDFLDPDYLKKRDLAIRKARALVVYLCCPAVNEKKPGLVDEGEILEFVKGILTANILELIQLAADAGGLDVDEEVRRRANFTSTPGSES